MKALSELKKEDIRNIKLVAFDVDGVLVPRGTEIKQKGDLLAIKMKRLGPRQIELIEKLHNLGFLVNINSGRGLYMLQRMFFEVLPFISLTYENGSATWWRGKVYQHVNSFAGLRKVFEEVLVVKSKEIRGFEPKEFIISIHCRKRVKAIESIASRHRNVYCIWNGEAYDIGIRGVQTKLQGLKHVMKLLRLRAGNVLMLGDNYNDKNLFGFVGVMVSADKSRLVGDFYVPLRGKKLPSEILMNKLISLKS